MVDVLGICHVCFPTVEVQVGLCLNNLMQHAFVSSFDALMLLFGSGKSIQTF